MLENLSLLEVIGSVLGAAMTVFFGWLAKKMKASDAEKEAIEALNIGVNQVYQNYVRDLKKGKEDGQLTDEEAKHARELAVKTAKEVASGPALRLLLSWGAPRLMSLVQDLVNRKKKR